MTGKRSIVVLLLTMGQLERPAAQSLFGDLESSLKDLQDHLKDQQDQWLPIVLFILGAALLHMLVRWIVHRQGRRSNRRRMWLLRWYPVSVLAIWAITLAFILITLFMNSDYGLTVLAALLILLGLAAREGIADLLAGVWLTLIDRPYQIGDRVTIGDYYGEIKAIKIRSTQINTLDDNLVTIPNSMVLSSAVSNANAGDTNCLVVVDLWLPPDAPLSQARSIVREAAVTSRYFNFDKKNKPVEVLVFDTNVEQPAAQLRIKAYVLDPRFEKAFASDVTETAKQAFRKAGIGYPPPSAG